MFDTNSFTRYVSYVQDVRYLHMDLISSSNTAGQVSTSNAEAAEREGQYLKAKEAADDEYGKAVEKFEKIHKLDPSVKFQDWMNRYATDYVEACRVRDALASKLRHSSVKLAKEMFDDAQARLEPKQG